MEFEIKLCSTQAYTSLILKQKNMCPQNKKQKVTDQQWP